MDEEWIEHPEDLQQQGLKRSVSGHIPILLVNGTVDWNDMDKLKGSMLGKLRKLKRKLRKWNGNA